MSEDFETVLNRVSKHIEPDEDERAALEAAAETLRKRARRKLADLPVEGEPILAGSAARDTWLAGDRDIDLFISFPPDITRSELRSFGLEVGHAVLEGGHEEFAEHPYVVGQFRGFDIDVVPCYGVAEATDIQSAVDRTPFHTRYVTDRLTPARARDVRLCKQFLTGIGVYGSNLRTKGFSGYLTELLVLEYGGFRELLEAAADWQPPVHLDPEDHAAQTFDDSLVVIDPTDPRRNVAAVLSTANVARFQHYARELLADPREELFDPPQREPLDSDTIRERFTERATTPVAIQFEAPDVVDDQLWPQLERSSEGIASELHRRGFDLFRTDIFVTDRDAVLFFELAVAERPAVERHVGPPVHVRVHAESFYQTYAGDDDTPASPDSSRSTQLPAESGPPFGPFIHEDRYVVERSREFTSAREFLDSEALFDVALGTHVESALEERYRVLTGDDVAILADGFGEQFARYLSPSPRRN